MKIENLVRFSYFQRSFYQAPVFVHLSPYLRTGRRISDSGKGCAWKITEKIHLYKSLLSPRVVCSVVGEDSHLTYDVTSIYGKRGIAMRR